MKTRLVNVKEAEGWKLAKSEDNIIAKQICVYSNGTVLISKSDEVPALNTVSDAGHPYNYAEKDSLTVEEFDAGVRFYIKTIASSATVSISGPVEE